MPNKSCQTEPIQTRGRLVLDILRREFGRGFIHCDQLHSMNDRLIDDVDNLREANRILSQNTENILRDYFESRRQTTNLIAINERRRVTCQELRNEVSRLRQALRMSAERTRPLPRRVVEILDDAGSETEWVTTDSDTSEDLLEWHVARRQN
jgi:hypothetical protein